MPSRRSIPKTCCRKRCAGSTARGLSAISMCPATAFAALKLNIDNWRWAGVPFYLRTGKRLAERHTEITIHFKTTPFAIFHQGPVHKLHANQLVIQIQPTEAISLSFGAKIPGPILRVGSVDMSFEYTKYFKAEAYTGYEFLFYD